MTQDLTAFETDDEFFATADTDQLTPAEDVDGGAWWLDSAADEEE